MALDFTEYFTRFETIIAEADAAFWQDAAERLLGAPPGTVPLLPVARRSMTFWKGDEIHANK
jgi:hypothetical protein